MRWGKKETYKVDADGGHVVLREGVVCEAPDQRRLANTRISNDDDLEPIVTIGNQMRLVQCRVSRSHSIRVRVKAFMMNGNVLFIREGARNSALGADHREVISIFRLTKTRTHRICTKE